MYIRVQNLYDMVQHFRAWMASVFAVWMAVNIFAFSSSNCWSIFSWFAVSSDSSFFCLWSIESRIPPILDTIVSCSWALDETIWLRFVSELEILVEVFSNWALISSQSEKLEVTFWTKIWPWKLGQKFNLGNNVKIWRKCYLRNKCDLENCHDFSLILKMSFSLNFKAKFLAHSSRSNFDPFLAVFLSPFSRSNCWPSFNDQLLTGFLGKV